MELSPVSAQVCPARARWLVAVGCRSRSLDVTIPATVTVPSMLNGGESSQSHEMLPVRFAAAPEPPNVAVPVTSRSVVLSLSWNVAPESSLKLPSTVTLSGPASTAA